MNLTGKQRILLHLLRVGRCKYHTGQMRTEFRQDIYGQNTWRHHLFMEGMIQTDKAAVNPKAKNVYANVPRDGDEIELTPAGRVEAERLFRKHYGEEP